MRTDTSRRNRERVRLDSRTPRLRVQNRDGQRFFKIWSPNCLLLKFGCKKFIKKKNNNNRMLKFLYNNFFSFYKLLFASFLLQSHQVINLIHKFLKIFWKKNFNAWDPNNDRSFKNSSLLTNGKCNDKSEKVNKPLIFFSNSQIRLLFIYFGRSAMRIKLFLNDSSIVSSVKNKKMKELVKIRGAKKIKGKRKKKKNCKNTIPGRKNAGSRSPLFDE